jgi:hypothetical protein
MLKSKFYRDADRLHAELQKLRLRYPTLLLDKELHEHLFEDMALSIEAFGNAMLALADQMVLAGDAMARVADAMDQSNLDDSDTPDTPACTGRLAFLCRIGRRVRRAYREPVERLDYMRLEIYASPPLSRRQSFWLRVVYVALVYVLLIIVLSTGR